MLRRLRPYLFAVFVLAFFITAGSVLFSAFGYRFSFERGIFIYTGSITLESRPEAVLVKIDGETVPQKRLGIINNSIHIGGLQPGEHFIEVSAPGYRPWSKKAVVQSGISTEFWNVILARETYDSEELPGTAWAEKMFAAPQSGLYAIAKETGDHMSIDTYEEGVGTQVFSNTEYVFDANDPENVEWSPQGDKLLIPLKSRLDGTRAYFVVDIETKAAIRLSDLAAVTAPLRGARWDPVTRNRIFFLQGTTLYQTDVAAGSVETTLLRDRVSAFDLSNRNIYYLQSESGAVYRVPAASPTDTATQVSSTAVRLEKTAEAMETSPYTLVIYDEDRYTVLDTATGSLFIFNQSRDAGTATIWKELGTGIKGSQFSNDGKKLLYFTDTEIATYFLVDWEVQPLREADSSVQIARFSSPIKNVTWTEDYEHVLFSQGSTIKLIELDHRDRRNLSDLLSLPKPPLQILPSFSENRLFFITGAEATIDSIIFPEANTFFGR